MSLTGSGSADRRRQRTTPRPDTLNLGCGTDHDPDAWNVDVSGAVDPDQQVDLQETPWPWPDDAFETIRARHVLEHLDPVPWAELVRVLAPGGRIELTYPIGHTRFEDPTHRQFWNVNTAEASAGHRAHEHQFPERLELASRSVDWWISDPEPLVALYTRYRLWRRGVGPWLEQIPGLYGEVTATYQNGGDAPCR